jgi:hypothetical protein
MLKALQVSYLLNIHMVALALLFPVWKLWFLSPLGVVITETGREGGARLLLYKGKVQCLQYSAFSP